MGILTVNMQHELAHRALNLIEHGYTW